MGVESVSVEAEASAVTGRGAVPDDGDTLKAAVTAPPEDGKANDAVIGLLAEAWRLPRSAFEIVKGQAARSKTVRVSGEPSALAERVGRWVQDHG